MAIMTPGKNTSELYDYNRKESLILLDVAGFILIPIIVCGNVLIIAAVCRFKKLRCCTNVMIVSLAFGDLMIGGLNMPVKLLLFHNDGRGPFAQRFPCLLNIFCGYFSVTTTMFFLSMLSIERFYAIQFPFHYNCNMTITRSVLWSVVTITVTFGMTIPIICGIDAWIPGNVCFGSDILPGWYVLTTVSSVFLVSLAGFLSFVRVFFAEIKARMTIRRRMKSEIRRHDSVKSTLVLTVYMFSIICLIPQLVYLFISMTRPGSTTVIGLRSVYLLGVCSSGVNCFIYGIKNSKFREAFKMMFSCKSPQVIPTTVAHQSTLPNLF